MNGLAGVCFLPFEQRVSDLGTAIYKWSNALHNRNGNEGEKNIDPLNASAGLWYTKAQKTRAFL